MKALIKSSAIQLTFCLDTGRYVLTQYHHLQQRNVLVSFVVLFEGFRCTFLPYDSLPSASAVLLPRRPGSPVRSASFRFSHQALSAAGVGVSAVRCIYLPFDGHLGFFTFQLLQVVLPGTVLCKSFCRPMFCFDLFSFPFSFLFSYHFFSFSSFFSFLPLFYFI